jgi:HEAT repeat protein
MAKKLALIILVLIASAQMVYGQADLSTDAQTADQILKQAMMEKNPDKRKEAVIALSLEKANDDVFSLMETALNDNDVPVRMAACVTLAALKDKRSIALLEKALQDEVPEVSFVAAQELWLLDQPAGKEVLISVLEGEKKPSSGYITKQKRDAMRTLKVPSALFRFAMKTGVGFVPVPGLGTGISSMEGLLKDPGVSGRALAALLLEKDKDPATAQILRDALSDKDWSVRAAAVHSLALRNQPDVLKDIAPLLEDKKDAVRYRAAAAYLRLELISKESKSRKPAHRQAKRL